MYKTLYVFVYSCTRRGRLPAHRMTRGGGIVTRCGLSIPPTYVKKPYATLQLLKVGETGIRCEVKNERAA